jgi:hypothetical protein
MLTALVVALTFRSKNRQLSPGEQPITSPEGGRSFS